MDIQKILFNEIAGKQVTIDTLQDKLKDTTINTDTSHLIREINIISEGDRRKKMTKLIFYMTIFLLLAIIMFRIIS